MNRIVYILALVLVGVWAFPLAVFGQPDDENGQNDHVIDPTIEQNVDDQVVQNDTDDKDEEQKVSKKCTEFIPPDERNPNLSPEERKYAEQNRKFLEENFRCEEQGDHYQKWVSKDNKVVTFIWTNPLDTLRFWTPERLEDAKPYINKNYSYIDSGKLIKKDIKPPGPPGKIEPVAPQNSDE